MLQANEQLKEYVLFVGNTGSGKSTLLNSIIGKVVFKSGFSLGNGITAVLQWEYFQGVEYGDTPGLSDVRTRKQAASEINKALQKNGKYKLIFVITLEGGQIKPDDLTTMSVVLEAIEDKTFPYAIVVNKTTRRLKEELKDETKYEEFLTMVNCNHRETNNIFLQSFKGKLVDADNKFVEADPKFLSFLTKLSSKLILPQNVKQIKVDEFEQIREAFKSQLEALRKDKHFLQENYDKQIKNLEASLQQTRIEDAEKLEKFEAGQKEVIEKMERNYERKLKIKEKFCKKEIKKREEAIKLQNSTESKKEGKPEQQDLDKKPERLISCPTS